jgi:hypothetical protein
MCFFKTRKLYLISKMYFSNFAHLKGFAKYINVDSGRNNFTWIAKSVQRKHRYHTDDVNDFQAKGSKAKTTIRHGSSSLKQSQNCKILTHFGGHLYNNDWFYLSTLMS